MFTMAYLNVSLLLIFVSVMLNIPFPVHGIAQVPCYFIFGDSQADNGNNNGLPTSSKANYPPYGIDFPSGPTGRFNNGRTTADIIAQFLGLGLIPPFANATNDEIMRGVSYASGSAGILEESGSNLGFRISLPRQLITHNELILRLIIDMGYKNTDLRYLNQCLYTIQIGADDYLNNYFLPGSPSSIAYTPDQFARKLINQYGLQIQALYAAGARKIALFSLGQIGCTPFEIATNGKNRSCADNVNSAAKLFDDMLKSLVDELNKKLADAKIIYINKTSISSVENLSSNGITVLASPCCPVNNIGGCIPDSIPCANRNEYLFFDGFHPTEAANNLTASRAYKAANASDAYPYDISTLVQR